MSHRNLQIYLIDKHFISFVLFQKTNLIILISKIKITFTIAWEGNQYNTFMPWSKVDNPT